MEGPFGGGQGRGRGCSTKWSDLLGEVRDGEEEGEGAVVPNVDGWMGGWDRRMDGWMG